MGDVRLNVVIGGMVIPSLLAVGINSLFSFRRYVSYQSLWMRRSFLWPEATTWNDGEERMKQVDYYRYGAVLAS